MSALLVLLLSLGPVLAREVVAVSTPALTALTATLKLLVLPGPAVETVATGHVRVWPDALQPASTVQSKATAHTVKGHSHQSAGYQCSASFSPRHATASAALQKGP